MDTNRDGLWVHWAPGGHQPWALLGSSLLLLSCVLLYTSTLRLLGRFTTCLAQTTTASRLLFALGRHLPLGNAKKIGNFRV